jgi:hypothetical protein
MRWGISRETWNRIEDRARDIFLGLSFCLFVAMFMITPVNGLIKRVQPGSPDWGAMTMEANYGMGWRARMAGAQQTNAVLYETMRKVLSDTEVCRN